MLFDLYNSQKELEYDYWVSRVHLVASVLGYDYFKLWDLPEYEFNILERYALEELEKRQKKLDELKENNK